MVTVVLEVTGSGMISLIFCLDNSATSKDENYNKPGAYNCLNGGNTLECLCLYYFYLQPAIITHKLL